jgi:hypothetical protein
MPCHPKTEGHAGRSGFANLQNPYAQFTVVNEQA